MVISEICPSKIGELCALGGTGVLPALPWQEPGTALPVVAVLFGLEKCAPAS